MTVKYRTREVAKDLGVASKDIVDILKNHLNVERKAMTTLTTDELNFILDHYTKNYSVENFDSYFAVRRVDNIKSENSESIEEILKVYKSKIKTKKELNEKKSTSNQKIKKEVASPVFQVKPKFEGETKFIQESEVTDDENTKKIINTKSESINIDKYNEKYDKIAASKNIFGKQIETSVSKQKIHQKIHQYKKSNKKRESESERLARIAKERKAKPMTISIPSSITVGELAVKLKASTSEVIKKLIGLGMMLSVNSVLDFDSASLVALEFHAKVNQEITKTIEEMVINETEDKSEDLVSRPPIIVVMGHVDHGKTSLLDKIRKANVVESEHGGITQHIGAYKVFINSKQITFLDTPGHEAFTSLRARGASITDIAILVVSWDDGVMPQTIEAINHIKEADISVIVAINKMDKPSANSEKVKQQLAEHGIVSEAWGGDVPCVEVSAKTGEGIKELLEMINLVAEIKELKANPNRAANGVVLEARLDKGSGPISTFIVTTGTLKRSDLVVAGTAIGRIRTMKSDKGNLITVASPSDPVEITGLDSIPLGGDKFNVVSDERLARQLVEQRKFFIDNERFNVNEKVTFENLFSKIEKNDIKEFKIIIKADVGGSLEALKQSIEKIEIKGEDIKAKVIHGAIGAIKESDVSLALASNALIIGFNVRSGAGVDDLAKNSGVEIKLYRVIYDCVNDITAALTGMLVPKTQEIELGIAQCRKVYKLTGVGFVAGCYILEGKIERGALIQVIRDSIIITNDKILSLRRSKDDVKEVTIGYECGIKLDKFSDFKVLDEFRAYKIEECTNTSSNV